MNANLNPLVSFDFLIMIGLEYFEIRIAEISATKIRWFILSAGNEKKEIIKKPSNPNIMKPLNKMSFFDFEIKIRRIE